MPNTAVDWLMAMIDVTAVKGTPIPRLSVGANG
jgi:hypothetical protein